jgi:hypothetical protein
MTQRLTAIAFVIAAVLLLPDSAAAQLQSAYPNVDKRIELAPGEVIVLLNRVVNEGGPAARPPGRRLDLQYSTAVPASDSLGRLEQADRAAQLFGPQAIEMGVRRLSIGICETRACAERRDPPSTWYLYERTANGWRRSRF